MPYVDVGASRLYYESHGDGPPVVLAHGVGGNHASWFRQVPVLSATYRVIVFDHRAFGNSSDVEETGRSSYVSDLLALLDALQIGRAVLIGQSMGGGTSAAFACAHPDRVHALVIAASLAGIDAPEPIATALRENDAATWGLSQAERVLGPVIRDDDPALSLLYLQIASFNSVNIRTVRGTMPRWTPAGLAETGKPILFVAGEHDVLFTPAMIEAVQKLVPGSRYSLIEGSGHSAYFERAPAFNARVGAYLAEIEPW